ncbi:hypothetical protein H6758_03185 [Candidatus Nomurabacteria bacterium]|nr:hypothetical protein [Candidatus Nomurabacteria bacterium]
MAAPELSTQLVPPEQPRNTETTAPPPGEQWTPKSAEQFEVLTFQLEDAGLVDAQGRLQQNISFEKLTDGQRNLLKQWESLQQQAMDDLMFELMDNGVFTPSGEKADLSDKEQFLLRQWKRLQSGYMHTQRVLDSVPINIKSTLQKAETDPTVESIPAIKTKNSQLPPQENPDQFASIHRTLEGHPGTNAAQRLEDNRHPNSIMTSSDRWVAQMTAEHPEYEGMNHLAIHNAEYDRHKASYMPEINKLKKELLTMSKGDVFNLYGKLQKDVQSSKEKFPLGDFLLGVVGEMAAAYMLDGYDKNTTTSEAVKAKLSKELGVEKLLPDSPTEEAFFESQPGSIQEQIESNNAGFRVPSSGDTGRIHIPEDQNVIDYAARAEQARNDANEYFQQLTQETSGNINAMLAKLKKRFGVALKLDGSPKLGSGKRYKELMLNNPFFEPVVEKLRAYHDAHVRDAKALRLRDRRNPELSNQVAQVAASSEAQPPKIFMNPSKPVARAAQVAGLAAAGLAGTAGLANRAIANEPDVPRVERGTGASKKDAKDAGIDQQIAAMDLEEQLAGLEGEEDRLDDLAEQASNSIKELQAQIIAILQGISGDGEGDQKAFTLYEELEKELNAARALATDIDEQRKMVTEKRRGAERKLASFKGETPDRPIDTLAKRLSSYHELRTEYDMLKERIVADEKQLREQKKHNLPSAAEEKTLLEAKARLHELRSGMLAIHEDLQKALDETLAAGEQLTHKDSVTGKERENEMLKAAKTALAQIDMTKSLDAINEGSYVTADNSDATKRFEAQVAAQSRRTPEDQKARAEKESYRKVFENWAQSYVDLFSRNAKELEASGRPGGLSDLEIGQSKTETYTPQGSDQKLTITYTRVSESIFESTVALQNGTPLQGLGARVEILGENRYRVSNLDSGEQLTFRRESNDDQFAIYPSNAKPYQDPTMTLAELEASIPKKEPTQRITRPQMSSNELAPKILEPNERRDINIVAGEPQISVEENTKRELQALSAREEAVHREITENLAKLQRPAFGADLLEKAFARFSTPEELLADDPSAQSIREMKVGDTGIYPSINGYFVSLERTSENKFAFAILDENQSPINGQTGVLGINENGGVLQFDDGKGYVLRSNQGKTEHLSIAAFKREQEAKRRKAEETSLLDGLERAERERNFRNIAGDLSDDIDGELPVELRGEDVNHGPVPTLSQVDEAIADWKKLERQARLEKMELLDDDGPLVDEDRIPPVAQTKKQKPLVPFPEVDRKKFADESAQREKIAHGDMHKVQERFQKSVDSGLLGPDPKRMAENIAEADRRAARQVRRALDMIENRDVLPQMTDRQTQEVLSALREKATLSKDDLSAKVFWDIVRDVFKDDGRDIGEYPGDDKFKALFENQDAAKKATQEISSLKDLWSTN